MSDVALNGGVMMPRIGFGTYPMKGTVCEKAVEDALDVGYRLLDTAFSYNNHKEIGNVLKAYFDSGKLKRGDVFITSKVTNIFMDSVDAVKECLELSLKDLQIDYVDLFLIHGPCASKVAADDPSKKTFISCDLGVTWKGMEACVDAGLARAIGVSNFNLAQLEKVVSSARIPVSNLQVECHAYLQQRDLREYCTRHNISVTAYAPLGNPGREKGFRKIIEDPTILEIAKKYGRSPAQIMLRFLLSANIEVVPKSSNRHHMEENLQASSFTLQQQDLDQLKLLDCGLRYFDMLKIWKGHPDYPFSPMPSSS